MELTKQEHLFETIANTLKEIGLEYYMLQGAGGIQIGDTLRTLVPVTDRGDAVLVELSLARLTEEIDFLQVYTTLIMEVGKGYEELLKASSNMNFYCPVGAFGIFGQERQFYHKYCVLVDPQEDTDTLAADAITAFEAIYDILSAHFSLSSRLSEGEITYRQAVEQGLLKE